MEVKALELSDELKASGVSHIYYSSESIEIHFTDTDKVISLPILKWQHETIMQLHPFETDGLINGNQLTQLLYFLNLELPKIWDDISVSSNGYKEEIRKTKAQIIIDKARDNTIKFFKDELNQAQAAVKVNDHIEILPLQSPKFKDWLSRILYKEENEIINSSVLTDVIAVLNAEAMFDSGDPIKLNLRVAQRTEPIIAGDATDARDATVRYLWYYDLTNPNHELIEITSEGWRIVKNTELLLFRRFNTQAPQVYPLQSEKGADMFNEFLELLLNKNVKEENKKDYRLLLGVYIISLLVPEISKPILFPHGSKGALKSTLSEKIKDIVDPSVLKTLSFPRDKNEFIQQLSHNYVAYYDNISILKDWISDEVCRAVSGSGSSKRQLYTDDDDKIYNFKRCLGINGINLAATKPDILDRGLQFQLRRVEKYDRLPEARVNKKFEELRPYVLGYIFEILAKVIHFRETQKIQLEEYERMADFTEYGEIISRCMGNKDNEFVEAYSKNTDLQIDEIIESSEIARCLIHMMFVKYEGQEFIKSDGSKIEDWIGTASQLLGELNNIAETLDLNIDTRSHEWPKAPHILTMRLNEIIPTLKEKGLEIETLTNQGKDNSRAIRIHRIKKTAPPASPASPEDTGARN